VQYRASEGASLSVQLMRGIDGDTQLISDDVAPAAAAAVD